LSSTRRRNGARSQKDHISDRPAVRDSNRTARSRRSNVIVNASWVECTTSRPPTTAITTAATIPAAPRLSTGLADSAGATLIGGL
jgi:hypothetical protein